MTTKTPREAFDEYIEMLKKRERAAEQHAVSTGGVQNAPMIDWGQAAGGVTEFIVGGMVYRLGKFPANDKKVSKYQKDVDAKYRAAQDAEARLKDVKFKEGYDAQIEAAEERLTKIDKRLAEVDAQLKAGTVDISSDPEVQKWQAEVDRLTVSDMDNNPTVKRAQAKVDTLKDVQAQKGYAFKANPELEKSLKIKNGKIGPNSLAADLGVVKITKNGATYYVFPETDAAIKHIQQNMRVDGSGVLAEPSNRDISKFERHKVGKVFKDGVGDIDKQITAAEDELTKAKKAINPNSEDLDKAMRELEKAKKTAQKNIKTPDELKTERVKLLGERRVMNEDLANLRNNPPASVKNAEDALNKAKAQLDDTVKKAPKGVKVDTSVAPPKAVKAPKATGWSKYFKNAGRVGLKALGIAGMAWGALDVIDAWNPQDLEQGSGTRNATDVQGDQGSQYSGSVSPNDEKYFKDDEYIEKFVKVMYYYGIHPMNDEKGAATYLPSFVMDHLEKMVARGEAEPRYVDASELELRKVLVAEYNKNPAKFDEIDKMRSEEDVIKARKVLAYYIVKGGRDKYGNYYDASYWQGRALEAEKGGYTGAAMERLMDDLVPNYDDVNAQVKAEEEAENISRSQTDGKSNSSSPAPGKGGKTPRPEAGRKPGMYIDQNAQGNVSNALRGAGQVLPDEDSAIPSKGKGRE